MWQAVQRYVQLTYRSELPLFFIVVPEHLDAFVSNLELIWEILYR